MADFVASGGGLPVEKKNCSCWRRVLLQNVMLIASSSAARIRQVGSGGQQQHSVCTASGGNDDIISDSSIHLRFTQSASKLLQYPRINGTILAAMSFQRLESLWPDPAGFVVVLSMPAVVGHTVLKDRSQPMPYHPVTPTLKTELA